MSLETYINIAFAVLSLILIPIIRYFMQRLNSIDEELETKLNERTVRQIISDKTDPIDAKCDKIDSTVNKILDHIINQKINNK